MHISNISLSPGQAGFKTGAYKNLKGLLNVAKKTALNKKIFDRQLKNAYLALKLGLTRLLCVYNVLLVKDNYEIYNGRILQKVNLHNLDRKLEEFKSKREKSTETTECEK